mmetsp:Transcript_11143/g.20052  ORF Transcript_11143/g.20052 Transcript_11143/m.20052 type:complete len:128 (+) Transcript_11143:1250-1633(+)
MRAPMKIELTNLCPQMICLSQTTNWSLPRHHWQLLQNRQQSTSSTGGSDLSSPETSFASNKTSAEDISFQSLAEWLQPPSTTFSNSTIGSDSMEIALKQISEQGNVSMCKLLTHDFQDEADLLRSLY